MNSEVKHSRCERHHTPEQTECNKCFSFIFLYSSRHTSTTKTAAHLNATPWLMFDVVTVSASKTQKCLFLALYTGWGGGWGGGVLEPGVYRLVNLRRFRQHLVSVTQQTTAAMRQAKKTLLILHPSLAFHPGLRQAAVSVSRGRVRRPYS